VMGLVYFSSGLTDRLVPIADAILKDLRQQDVPRRDFDEVGKFFHEIGRWDDFEKIVADSYPREMLAELRDRLGLRAVHRR